MLRSKQEEKRLHSCANWQKLASTATHANAIEWTQLILIHRHQNSLCYLPVVGGASSLPLELAACGGTSSSSSESSRGCDPFPLGLAEAVEEPFAVLDGMVWNLNGSLVEKREYPWVGFVPVNLPTPLFFCWSVTRAAPLLSGFNHHPSQI